MAEARPFQRLDDRLAGKPLDDVLLPGVPPHLVTPVREWIEEVLPIGGYPPMAEDVFLSLQWPRPPGRRSYEDALVLISGDDLLTAVDAMLQLNPEYVAEYRVEVIEPYRTIRLDTILRRARSAYRVADDRAGLVYRVDPTAEQVFRDTVTAAPPTAGDLLRKAWHHAYKPDPDPTTAYRDAIRAVEEVACPWVLPNDDKATLGKVVANLRQASGKWETVLVDKDGNPGNPEPVAALLDRLWTGQVSRHSGGKQSRDQDPAEAEAAVHGAVLAVQWLTSGVLRRKP